MTKGTRFIAGGDSTMSRGRASTSPTPYTPGGNVPDKPYPPPGNYNASGQPPAMLAFDDPRPKDPMMAKMRKEMGMKEPKNTWDQRDAYCEMEKEAE